MLLYNITLKINFVPPHVESPGLRRLGVPNSVPACDPLAVPARTSLRPWRTGKVYFSYQRQRGGEATLFLASALLSGGSQACRSSFPQQKPEQALHPIIGTLSSHTSGLTYSLKKRAAGLTGAGRRGGVAKHCCYAASAYELFCILLTEQSCSLSLIASAKLAPLQPPSHYVIK